MSIHLATSSEVVLDFICTINIVFCYVSGHDLTKHFACWIMNNLQYNILLGVGWLKFTNPVKDWVDCYLELTLHDNLLTVLALLVTSVANVTLYGLK